MSDDVLITPASRKIEFKDGSGNIDGKIELDGSGNLNITSTGNIAIGDITQDIHVGDGTQAVDLVFDFTSSIYSVANQDLTIGKKSLGGNDIIIDTPSYLNVVTDSGYVRVGPANTSWSHFTTDRGKFYFNKPIVIDGGDTTGGAFTISSYSTEDLVLATENGTEDRITIKSDTGNVGIGEVSPDETLHVKVASGDSGAIAKFERASNVSVFIGGGNAWGNLWTDDSVLAFGTGNNSGANSKMVINGSNVGIGTTSPGSYKLVVEETTNPQLRLQNPTNAANGWDFRVGDTGSLIFKDDGTERVRFASDGDVVFAGGIETTSSTKGWNTWSMMRFGKLDYGTAAGGGAGLSSLTFDDDEAGFSNITIPTNITIRAVQIRTNGVVLATHANKADAQVLRIFANGDAGQGTLTDLTYDMEDFTRQNSENTNATAHSYTVTGLSATYNAGDTMSVRRNSGAYNMGDYIVDIYYSMIS